MTGLPFLETASGDRIAYRYRPGRGPVILFLPGDMSDMDGGKATALDEWAAAEGRAMLRFDYRGCGASSGDFESFTLADWRDDTLLMLDEMLDGEPAILVGSSMGGWLMLLAALARPEQVKGLVGIAAAPDFTSWGFTPEQKMTILQEGRLTEPSPYGDTPYVTTRAFWESGGANRVLHGPVPIDCPVRLLHGRNGRDVPWTWSLDLMEKLRSADVQTFLVKDGDHRLSRESDIALLIAAVKGLLETL